MIFLQHNTNLPSRKANTESFSDRPLYRPPTGLQGSERIAKVQAKPKTRPPARTIWKQTKHENITPIPLEELHWRKMERSTFGACKLSFEPTVCIIVGCHFHMFIHTYWISQADDNVYQVTTYPGFHGSLARDLPPPNEQGIRLVEFKQHADFELPSRTLLGIHAALARIMHASGMG